jgi:hypothetical protein
MNSNSAALIVPPPAAVSATNDIRGLKPPVPIPSGYAWLGWLLVLLAMAAAGIWAWRRWRQRRLAPVSAVVLPPHVRARRKLEQALHYLGDPRQFCTAVSDALRAYLEERFQLRAPERTTEEFLHDLQQTDVLTTGQKLVLTDFLQRCDLVKFARFEPDETALKDLHESALRLVDETAAYGLESAAATPPNPEADR